MTTQHKSNLWNTMKAVLKGKLIALHAHKNPSKFLHRPQRTVLNFIWKRKKTQDSQNKPVQ